MTVDALALLRRLREERKASVLAAALPRVADPAPAAPTVDDDAKADVDVPPTKEEARAGALCRRDFELRRADGTATTLRLLEDPAGVWGGGNGATLWDCGVLLARHLEETADAGGPPLLAAGGSVLELGAGCGLVAMAAAALGPDRLRVVATERRLALPLLRRNVAENGLGPPAAGGRGVEVVECGWEAPPDALLAGPWDLVLGADLVFPANAGSHAALAALLAALLAGRGTVALLAHEARGGPDVERGFWDLLRARGVRVETLRSTEGLELLRLSGGRQDDADPQTRSLEPHDR